MRISGWRKNEVNRSFKKRWTRKFSDLPGHFHRETQVFFTLHRVCLYNFFENSMHFTGTLSAYHMRLFFYQSLSCIYTQQLQMKKTDVFILCFFFLGYIWHLMTMPLHFKCPQSYQTSSASSVDPSPENFYFLVITYYYFSLTFFHISALHILAFFPWELKITIYSKLNCFPSIFPCHISHWFEAFSLLEWQWV